MLQNRICKTCDRSFEGGPRAYYCPDCRAIRTKETNNAYQKRKRKGDIRPLGSKDKCVRCDKDYTVVGGLQRFCETCKPVHALEYDRQTSLPFYHEHKERINPVRKIKRRKRGNLCAWCNKEFDPVNGKTTCSETCRRQYVNKYYRDRRASSSQNKEVDNE